MITARIPARRGRARWRGARWCRTYLEVLRLRLAPADAVSGRRGVSAHCPGKALSPVGPSGKSDDMAVRIKTVGHVVPPGPPGQRAQFGRPAALVERGTWPRRPRPGRALHAGCHGRQQDQAITAREGTGFLFLASGQALPHFPGQTPSSRYVKSRRTVKDGLPEGCRRDLAGDIEDQMHGADHPTDDSRDGLAAIPQRGTPARRLIPERLLRLSRTELADLREVSHVGGADSAPD